MANNSLNQNLPAGRPPHRSPITVGFNRIHDERGLRWWARSFGHISKSEDISTEVLIALPLTSSGFPLFQRGRIQAV